MPTVLINELDSISWNDPSMNGFDLAGNIDIWRIAVASAASFLTMLAPDEFEKKDRFRGQANRDEFVTSRGALRYLSAKYLQEPPLSLVLSKGPNGKPCWEHENGKLHFNTAHSGGYVLIAFATAEIGIDVEKVNQGFDYSGILERCFDTNEAAIIKKATHQLETFYQLWTRKEAILKATGTGMHNDLHLIPCLNGNHDIPGGIIGSIKDWQVKSFEVAPGLMAAVVHEPAVSNIRFHELAF